MKKAISTSLLIIFTSLGLLAQDKGADNPTQTNGKSGKDLKTNYWLSPKDSAELVKMAKTERVENHSARTNINSTYKDN